MIENVLFSFIKANGQLLNINLIQNPAVKKLAERYLQCVNDFRQLQWQVSRMTMFEKTEKKFDIDWLVSGISRIEIFGSVRSRYISFLVRIFVHRHFIRSDVQGVTESSLIEEVQERVTNALGEYTTDHSNGSRSNSNTRSPSQQVSTTTATTTNSEQEKFACILLKLPDVRLIGNDLKKFLQLIDRKHDGKLLDGCLLGEMLNGLQSNS